LNIKFAGQKLAERTIDSYLGAVLRMILHTNLSPVQVKGVGGMNKNVFAKDFAAVDTEIERLKPLIELGGYIPCPNHRIPPDARWDNVRYYCNQMRKHF
jgi:hypothetical protein